MNMSSNPLPAEYLVRVSGMRKGIKKMKDLENMNRPVEMRSKESTKNRWHQDANGEYHYRGVCPFNNALCRLRNYFVRRSSTPKG